MAKIASCENKIEVYQQQKTTIQGRFLFIHYSSGNNRLLK